MLSGPVMDIGIGRTHRRYTGQQTDSTPGGQIHSRRLNLLNLLRCDRILGLNLGARSVRGCIFWIVLTINRAKTED